MEDKILYHGSRKGINGDDIKPISRATCDFGKGFYMGTDPKQVKGLVVDAAAPTFYILNFRLSEIPDNRILELKDEDWLYAVLANRRFSSEFNSLKLAKDWIKRLKDYDVIIGTIADDSMKKAIDRFVNGELTDKALFACLTQVNYGTQYVAKTDFACSKIERISEQMLTEKDFRQAYQYNRLKNKEAFVDFKRLETQYNRRGVFFSQLIEAEKEKEKQRSREYEK